MNNFYEKYGLITHGISRTYIVSGFKRVYGYERANLVYVKIKDHKIEASSWRIATQLVAQFLQANFPVSIDKLLSFRVDWTYVKFFDTRKYQTNCEEVEEGLWVSTNYSSTHAIYFFQDLVKFYGLSEDDLEIVVHLPSSSEPEEVIKYYKSHLLSSFKEYLADENLTEDAIGSVVRGIETLNKVLIKLNFGANDFFLMDSRTTLSLCKSKVLGYCKKEEIFKGKQMLLAERFLKYLTDFMKEYEEYVIINNI